MFLNPSHLKRRENCKESPRSGPEVIKLFSCSTRLSTKFILLINVKMPTIVGILTFISMINTTCERLKTNNFSICRYFTFYEQLKFCAQLSFVTLWPGPGIIQIQNRKNKFFVKVMRLTIMMLKSDVSWFENSIDQY